MALLGSFAGEGRRFSQFNSEWRAWERFMGSKHPIKMGGGVAESVARSSGGKRFRKYAIRGGIAAGALGGAYGVGRSSGVKGLTPGASGSGGYPTGMYGV